MKFTLNGKSVSPHEIGKRLQKALLDEVKAEVARRKRQARLRGTEPQDTK